MAGKKRKFTYSSIMQELVKRVDNKVYCAIDNIRGCSYCQDKYDATNFLRHFRTQHPEEAANHDLIKEPPAKRSRLVPKTPIAVNKQVLLESCIKLITAHHLPFSCLEWDGLRLLLDPISEALGVTINRQNVKIHLSVAAEKIKQAIHAETRGKLIHLAIDSASRHLRHVLGVNVQYEKQGAVAIRTLGMIEVKQSQTAKFLKEKILEILQIYEISIDQILSVTTDNGANMIAAVKLLQNNAADFENSYETILDDEAQKCDEKETDLLDALASEFGPLLCLTRCASHSLQLAVGDVAKKYDINTFLFCLQYPKK